MSTRNGFPRMNWDTGFLADPKFQHLRDLLPDPIHFGYAGFCYLRLVADAWRTCQRRPIRDVVRGIEPWAIDALREAALLEAELVLSETSFEQWIGDALKGRKAQAEKVRRSRELESVTVTDGHTPSLTISDSLPRVERSNRVERKGGTRGEPQLVDEQKLTAEEERERYLASARARGLPV